MKKISGFLSFTIVLAGFIVLSSCNGSMSSSGSDFEGVVTYGVVSNAGMPPEYAAMFQNMEMKTFIKGNLSRSEEEMAGSKSIILADTKTPDDPTMLISMFGRKYAVKLNDSLKKIEESNVPKIEYIDSTNATKQIAGYTCKKARITMTTPNSSSITSDVYYTTDLPYADPEGKFKGLKGMPMEFSLNMGGMNITISAKSVEKKTLSDSLFTVPSDYKQMSINDMEKDLMKNMPRRDSASADTSARQ